MTEAHSNPDLVAFHRQSNLEASQRAYQEQKDDAASDQSAPVATQAADASPVVTVPAAPPPDPATTLTALRLSIVAVVVLILLLLVLRQRRKQSDRF